VPTFFRRIRATAIGRMGFLKERVKIVNKKFFKSKILFNSLKNGFLLDADAVRREIVLNNLKNIA
jgi:hypothetical protein